jgi:hypothetical protein
MRRALIISAVFHIAIIAIALIGLPMFDRDWQPTREIIPVTLAPIAEKTSLPKKNPSPADLPPPATKPKASPPPPPAPTPPPPAAAEPPPPAPKKVDAVAPLTPKDPVPEKPVAAEPVKPEPQVVTPGPAPRVKPKRPPKFDANRIAALLDKSREQAPAPEQKNETETDDAPREPVPVSPALATPLTLSEIDAIRAQIQECWIVPAGARYAEGLVVRLRIFLRPDGELAGMPEVVDGDRMNRDSHYRTAAEHAIRAVQKCVPLKNLPPDKYERWRDIELTFDPREMLGG